jgi:hypothetical protein
MTLENKKSLYFISESMVVEGTTNIDNHIFTQNISKILGHDDWKLLMALKIF